LLFLAAPVCGAVPADSETGSWPRYAHDPSLTSRSPLHGNITKPQIHWSYSVGGRELRAEILPKKGVHPLRFVAKLAVRFGPRDIIWSDRTK
jgi:hypothetical protein